MANGDGGSGMSRLGDDVTMKDRRARGKSADSNSPVSFPSLFRFRESFRLREREREMSRGSFGSFGLVAPV